MTGEELRLLIFELLYEKLTANDDGERTVSTFVGLQGDKVVVMQAGGEHFGVVVVPAVVGAPA